MKTLDEVIKRIEPIVKHDTCWFDEHHCIIGETTIADALQYLKWYKDLADDSEAFAAWKENPPLTWEELKTMVGKPVWVEWVYDKEKDPDADSNMWMLVFDAGDNKEIHLISCFDDYFEKRKDLGKIWTAYRKERS